MYHSISDTPTYPWTVSPENFQRQMELIARSDLEVVGLDRIIKFLNEGRQVSRKLVITFDDGYIDNLTVAAPIMAQHGFTATVFISTGFIGKQSDWDTNEGWDTLPLLDWEGLKELHALGHLLGGHTHRHVNLIKDENLTEEIEKPIQLIREKTGQNFVPFAYPYGKWNPTVREAVIEAGYGCSCIAGGYFGNHPGTDRWLLRREPLLWNTIYKDFQARLKGVRCGGYWRLGFSELLSAPDK
jgi:peptidoglycan/xylan/chitin deacetylase (PgdA/CDA1 family)